MYVPIHVVKIYVPENQWRSVNVIVIVIIIEDVQELICLYYLFDITNNVWFVYNL